MLTYNHINLVIGLQWFILMIGLNFFDYKPSNITITVSFLLTSLLFFRTFIEIKRLQKMKQDLEELEKVNDNMSKKV